MGYHTVFSLSIEGIEDCQRVKLGKEIEKMNVFEDGNIDNGFTADATWYECDEDMLLLSSRFPNVLFTLNGYGDDAQDIWCHYYKNGRAMYFGIEITYHAFDESKLSEDRVPQGKTRYSYEEDPDYVKI